ncbi:putative sulfoacetate transporter SauU [Aquisphaera giovannonii]|uniref:Putative sulfoacetate transporter SauU n=1 Tax=Aquisphaera giovannonii TaxID=406548 RepID=A0A5B9WEN2_9BACT|nr:MFS transporter [Aquisphaera giovannonii]QEH38411.1 putative sulfoacetate transporter SauU [Aquisphaera giovannonii]
MATAEASPPSSSSSGARVLAFVCTLSMITYLDRACFGMALRPIAGELGLADASQLKWAVTAFAIAYAAFEVPAGAMGDRLGAKAMLTRIVVWWSACTALTGLIGLRVGGLMLGGVGTLVLLRFLFGAGEAGAYPNITRALHDRLPPRRWETAQGLVFMSGRLAGGLTPLLWAVLVGGTATSSPWITWRGAFLLFGAIGVIWAVAFRTGFPDHPDDVEGRDAPSHPATHAAVPWKALATNRTLWALCIMYLAVNYAWAFNLSYLPTYVEQRFGVGAEDRVGAVYKGAPLWVGAAGCLLGGPAVGGLARLLGDRRRARRVLGMSSLSLGAACWWGAARAEDVHLYCTLVALAAFSIDLTLGACWASCQDLGRGHAALVAACMNTVGTLGNALAGWLTGTLVEGSIAAKAQALRVPPPALSEVDGRIAALAGYESAFGTYVMAFALAAACWLFIDPGRGLAPEGRGAEPLTSDEDRRT